MEGRVSVERQGRHIYEFLPGDSLSDYIRYYVLADSSTTLGAVSQVEALEESTCKKVSGNRMSCTSCHDPQFSPSAQERVAYYRGKCLACHEAELGAKHHTEQKDCTACHMPASLSKDVAHTEVTDHRIPRLPGAAAQLSLRNTAPAGKTRLVPFPYSRQAEEDVRDLALAWESLADNGMEAARPQAEALLHQAAAKFSNDAAILSALGYEEQMHGNISLARKLYEWALAADPNLIDAATNLGVIEAQGGNLPASIDLLRGAFEHAPGRSTVGMNLARAYCLAARPDDARASIARILEFNPDMSAAKRMFEQLNRVVAAVSKTDCRGISTESLAEVLPGTMTYNVKGVFYPLVPFICPSRKLSLSRRFRHSVAIGLLALVPALCFGQKSTVDLDGRTVDPFKSDAGKILVMIFVRRDCPISGRYAPTIQRISTEHQNGARFYLVFPDKSESAASIRGYLHDFHYSIPVLRDLEHSLVKQAHAQVTPEAAVFDRKGLLVYHGRIDDLYQSFGRARPAPTTHELEDAIETALAGRSPLKSEVPGVGCYISDLE